jgi:glycyl-tRNA synthetase
MEIYNKLSKKWMCEFDDRQSIGKRYRRQDEIGTPFCITFDFDSLEDKCVTVRDRDTMAQVRIAIDKLEDYFTPKFVY